MKMSISKLLAIAIWLPVLILLGLSGYNAYTQYENYQKAEKSMKYLELGKKLENLLVYLGQERGVSSIYSVSKGNYPNSKQLIAKKRKAFDKGVNDLKSFLNKNPQFYNDAKGVLTFLNQLPIVRKKIDSFSIDYIHTYFFTYYTVLENKILNTEARIFKYFPQEAKSEFALKMELDKIIAYSGITRGFVSYFITADQPMNEEDYKNIFMKYYHDSNILITKLSSNAAASNFLNTKSFKDLETNIKDALFYIQQANMGDYINGEFDGYPIEAIDYFNMFTKRISYFKNSGNVIANNIQEKINHIETAIIQKRNIAIGIFAVALLLLILGFYINRMINNHIKELSITLNKLAPITGENIHIDINTPQGLHKALQITEEAIAITQEAVKKSQESSKAKSLFLANMSHEIRTPLNGILGFLELLKTTELTSEQEDYVNTVAQSAENLLQIVNNILDVSKIESNKLTLEEIDFKIEDEIENTLEVFATPCAQKEIEYVSRISPNIPSVVKGDVLKIKEVLTNLINNAIKFTPKNGTIEVTVKLNAIEENRANFYFEVKDSGIGMSEEQKNKVFEAFSQADESVTRKYGGTGLGLTIVKSYIEMMGGEIKVDSEINKGTKFYFDLWIPIVEPSPKYKKNIFSNLTFAVLNTFKESKRKEAELEYLSFFGVNRIGFNDAQELQKLLKTETLNAIVVFYEETQEDKVKELENINLPVILVSSFSQKQKIDNLNLNRFTIYDPTVPSKVYNSILFTKEKVKREVKKTEEKKEIYEIYALIAEDNPINMKLLETTLKGLGIKADKATNGLEAFNKYSSNPNKYDVILMDAQMPVMDGIEATQEILEFEKEEGISHTPIIVVTANVLKGDRERFLGAGMDDYISKPIKKDTLLKVLDNVAEHKYTQTEETVNTNENEKSQIPQNDVIKETEINQPTSTNNSNIEKEAPTPIINEETETKTEAEIKNDAIEEIEKAPTANNEKKENIIIASDVDLLADYLKSIVPNAQIAKDIKELSLKIDSSNANNIVLLEEGFNNSNIEILINTLRKNNNVKIIALTDKNVEADAVVKELTPETILNSIKKVEE